MSKSPNKHNKIFMRAEPLTEDVIELIKFGKLHEDMDKKELSRILRERGWSTDEARSVVAVDRSGNLLSDETKGVQFIQESMDSIRSGFDDVIHSGPIAQESVRGLRFVLHHFVPHEESCSQRTCATVTCNKKSNAWVNVNCKSSTFRANIRNRS